jgi:hypothetical protein
LFSYLEPCLTSATGLQIPPAILRWKGSAKEVDEVPSVNVFEGRPPDSVVPTRKKDLANRQASPLAIVKENLGEVGQES